MIQYQEVQPRPREENFQAEDPVSAKGWQSRSSRKSSEELLKEKIIKPESVNFALEF